MVGFDAEGLCIAFFVGIGAAAAWSAARHAKGLLWSATKKRRIRRYHDMDS